jgi:vacuolar-type H+-ATPase subunit D/Vma8
MNKLAYLLSIFADMFKIFCFGKDKEVENDYRNILGCEVGALPFKYLGTPIYYRSCRIKNGNQLRISLSKKLHLG